jgi:FMN phosphatase YigB (HAD superfamily)
MPDLAFLFDVDNTLLDNDRAKADMAREIERQVGKEGAAKFWNAYETVRRAVDTVDYPRTLTQFRAELPDEPNFPYVAALVLCYPYDAYVYPGACEALAHVQAFGTTAILSDGDAVYQPAKIVRAGLAAAVDGQMVVTLHKETHLAEVLDRFPAERHVLVDDKLRILAAAKGICGERIVTVHVRQGHYAAETPPGKFPPADITLETIGDLCGLTAADFRPRPR